MREQATGTGVPSPAKGGAFPVPEVARFVRGLCLSCCGAAALAAAASSPSSTPSGGAKPREENRTAASTKGHSAASTGSALIAPKESVALVKGPKGDVKGSESSKLRPAPIKSPASLKARKAVKPGKGPAASRMQAFFRYTPSMTFCGGLGETKGGKFRLDLYSAGGGISLPMSSRQIEGVFQARSLPTWKMADAPNDTGDKRVAGTFGKGSFSRMPALRFNAGARYKGSGAGAMTFGGHLVANLSPSAYSKNPFRLGSLMLALEGGEAAWRASGSLGLWQWSSGEPSGDYKGVAKQKLPRSASIGGECLVNRSVGVRGLLVYNHGSSIQLPTAGPNSTARFKSPVGLELGGYLKFWSGLGEFFGKLGTEGFQKPSIGGSKDAESWFKNRLYFRIGFNLCADTLSKLRAWDWSQFKSGLDHQNVWLAQPYLNLSESLLLKEECSEDMTVSSPSGAVDAGISIKASEAVKDLTGTLEGVQLYMTPNPTRGTITFQDAAGGDPVQGSAAQEGVPCLSIKTKAEDGTFEIPYNDQKEATEWGPKVMPAVTLSGVGTGTSPKTLFSVTCYPGGSQSALKDAEFSAITGLTAGLKMPVGSYGVDVEPLGAVGVKYTLKDVPTAPVPISVRLMQGNGELPAVLPARDYVVRITDESGNEVVIKEKTGQIWLQLYKSNADADSEALLAGTYSLYCGSETAALKDIKFKPNAFCDLKISSLTSVGVETAALAESQAPAAGSSELTWKTDAALLEWGKCSVSASYDGQSSAPAVPSVVCKAEKLKSILAGEALDLSYVDSSQNKFYRGKVTFPANGCFPAGGVYLFAKNSDTAKGYRLTYADQPEFEAALAALYSEVLERLKLSSTEYQVAVATDAELINIFRRNLKGKDALTQLDGLLDLNEATRYVLASNSNSSGQKGQDYKYVVLNFAKSDSEVQVNEITADWGEDGGKNAVTEIAFPKDSGKPGNFYGLLKVSKKSS